MAYTAAASDHAPAPLQAIADSNPFSERLQIIDCRPRLNAELNAAKGKGYEHSSQYANIKLTFADIANIHVMRASLKSLLQLLSKRDPTDDDFLQDLHKCGWLEHIRGVISTAARVKDLIHVDRSSVLVHCSDGWDRTPQVTALAQLLLDPCFRSLQGFGRLVVKEWLSFGHQFALRCGSVAPSERGAHAAHAPSDEQLSPVFLQFIEAVHRRAAHHPAPPPPPPPPPFPRLTTTVATHRQRPPPPHPKPPPPPPRAGVATLATVPHRLRVQRLLPRCAHRRLSLRRLRHIPRQLRTAARAARRLDCLGLGGSRHRCAPQPRLRAHRRRAAPALLCVPGAHALHAHCMCTACARARMLPAPCLPPACPRPLHSACQLRLWTAFYCRGGQLLRPDPHVLLEQRCAALAAERDDLRAEIARLRSLPATAAAAPVAAPATAAPATAVAPAATAPAAAAAPPAAAVAPAAAATRAAPAPAPASAAPAPAIAPAAPIAAAAPAAPAQPSATAATETATEPVPRVAPPAQEPPAPSDATDGERLAAAEVPP